jgi:hypothetical protein
MLAVQHRLPLALAARVRSCRRPFRPSPGQGPYRLPRDIADRLSLALAPFRNRDAAFALATFLARFWSVPGRVAGSFPIDRRELADRADLGLTEKRVRSAITTLEAVGFLERALTLSGSKYRATEEGLQRKPVLYVFSSEYGSAFVLANKRAQAARGRTSGARRMPSPPATTCPSVAILETFTKGPKSRERSETKVLMGPLRKGSGIPAEASQDSALERALQRLGEGVFGKPRVELDGEK